MTIGKNVVVSDGVRVRESIILEGATLKVCMVPALFSVVCCQVTCPDELCCRLVNAWFIDELCCRLMNSLVTDELC